MIIATSIRFFRFNFIPWQIADNTVLKFSFNYTYRILSQILDWVWYLFNNETFY
jgi:hypothetical protein